MPRCLNLSGDNAQKFEALEATVGRMEAVREFLEAADNDRPIGTPEQVIEKINRRTSPRSEEEVQRIKEAQREELMRKTWDPMYNDPDSTEGAAILFMDLKPGPDFSLQGQNNAQAVEIVQKLSAQTGIAYNMVTEEEAARITADSANPYVPGKGPGFFFNGEVYFIKDKLTTELAFHEFAHPVIRSIRKNNPELFDKLYREAIAASPEYHKQAMEEYAGLKAAAEQETDPDLKKIYEDRFTETVAEEVLVKALTDQAMHSREKIQPVPEKSGFFKELLFSIRQLLRKLFGRKSSVSKLDGNTTMGDLAKMLTEGGSFEISTEQVSQSDVVAYFDDTTRYVNDMQNVVNTVGNQKFISLIHLAHQGAVNQIRYLQSNQRYSDLVDLLVDEFNQGDLQNIRGNLSKYTSLIDQAAEKRIDQLKYTENQVSSFVASMMRLDLAIKKMKDHLKELQEDPSDRDNVHKAQYYTQVLNYWEKYINEFQSVLDKAGNPSNSPMNVLLNQIRGNIRVASESVTAIKTEGVADVLWDQWKIISQEADRIFNTKVENLIKRGMSDSVIEKEFVSYHGLTRAELAEYNSLKSRKEDGEILSPSELERLTLYESKTVDAMRVTKDKIQAKLRGEGKDANWANSYLEGYLYNTDPVIGGFAMYFKANMTEMEQRVQARINEISPRIQKLAKEAGVNFNDVGGLGRQIGFVDTIGVYDAETKTFKEKKVWTFLNPWKDYRFVLDKFNHEISELEKEYNRHRSNETKLALINKMNEKKKHMRQWFHQEFTDEYYDASDLIQNDSDEIGKLADRERSEILEEIRLITEPLLNEYDYVNNTPALDALWRKYRLLYSLYDANGDKKTGNDLLIAKRLQEHREKTRKFYEFRERPGAFQNALQKMESEIHSLLVKQKYVPGTQEYNDLFKFQRELWIKANTRVVLKKEFYDDRAKILDRIKVLMAKLPNSKLDFTKEWEEILDVTSGYRDDDGHPMGSEIPEGRKDKVKAAQEAIIRAKAEWAGFSGLTRKEYDRMMELFNKRTSVKILPENEYKEWIGLIEKQNAQGLSKSEIQELNKAFAELSELQSKEATDYYLDQLNHFLETMDLEEVYKDFGITHLDNQNLDMLYGNEELRKKLFEQSPQFKEWFMKNHVKKGPKDKVSYERLYVWNVIRPNNPKYYETTAVKDENGNVVPVMGLPKMKYYARVVKKEFRTGYDPKTDTVRPVVGVHMDNQGFGAGGWLPKMKEGSPYINQEYHRMKNAPAGSKENKLFLLMEELKAIHLKNQENLPKKDRLYLDFPRFEMSSLEMLQSGVTKKKVEAKMNFIQLLFKKLKDWITGNMKDDPNYNFDTKLQLVRTDAFGDQIDNIPIQGLYNLDHEETSTDIISSMMRYMVGGEQKKQLLKMNPTAKAIQQILEENKIKDTDKASLMDFVNNGIITWQNKKGKYVRKEAFNNMYDRDFLGETTKGFGSKDKWLINIQNFLFGRASFAFFALNVPSAVKNAGGQKFQAMVEAAAGENITPFSYAKGQLWAQKYVWTGSANIYDGKPKSVSHQIGDIFDFSQGRFLERAGDPLTRTVFKDVASMSWLYSHRKFLDLEATAHTFAGMMYKKKVKQNGKDIDYMDAWELDKSGQIRLKEGIDVRYGNVAVSIRLQEGMSVEELAKTYNIPVDEMRSIMADWKIEQRLSRVEKLNAEREAKLSTARDESERDRINKKYDELVDRQLNVDIDNTLFKGFRSKVHGVMQKLNGAYSKYDQPEAQRYLMFRFVSNLRRFFITMFMQRFGKRRWNPGYGAIDEGYYRAFIMGAWSAIKNLDPMMLTDLFRRGANVKDVETKRATYKVLSELGMVLALGAIARFVFGFEMDDEDKYEKLRQKSGPLPLFGLTADDEAPFNLEGWVSTHILNQIIQIKSENQQFIPLPYMGLSNFTELAEMKAIALGPTLNMYTNLLGDAMDFATQNPRQFYKRRAGVYEWQQQGSRKMWNHIGKMFGINAANLSPADLITNLSKAQGMSPI